MVVSSMDGGSDAAAAAAAGDFAIGVLKRMEMVRLEKSMVVLWMLVDLC